MLLAAVTPPPLITPAILAQADAAVRELQITRDILRETAQRRNAADVVFPELLQPPTPFGTHPIEWDANDRLAFDQAKGAVQAALQIVNAHLTPEQFRRKLLAENADADLNLSLGGNNIETLTTEIDNLIGLYGEEVKGRKREKFPWGTIGIGVGVGVVLLGVLAYAARRRNS